MTRMHFGLGPAFQSPRDPRDKLSPLAAVFEAQYEPYVLRRLLADAEKLTTPEGRETREAIASALRVAEMPPPAQPPPLGTPVPEGARFAVYATVDAAEPVGEVAAGPDGSIDLTPFADVLPGDGLVAGWIEPI